MTQGATSFAKAKKLPLGRRGRPRGDYDEELNNHLLLSAREVFFEVGLAGATMDMVCARAGMSKPTVYKRYKDKFDLFEAVMQASVDAWAEGAANNPVIDYKSLEEGLRNFVRVQMRAYISPEYIDLARLIFAEAKRFPHLGKHLLEKVASERIDSVVRHIRRFAELDGIPCRDPASVAEALRGMTSGCVQVIVLSEQAFGPNEQERLIDRIMQLFLPGRPNW